MILCVSMKVKKTWGEKKKGRCLRNLVPELKHSLPAQASSSGHFSLLQVKDKEDKMPFLNKVFDQVSREVTPRLKKRDFNKNVTAWYPTTEPAESVVFKQRSVPRVLRQFVPNHLISEGGASSQTTRLSNTSLDGVKEAAAIRAQLLASSGIRLANNFEIGVEVCNTLIQQSKQSLEVIQACDLPDNAKLAMAQLNRNMALMTNTVYDLKSTNNDLLKASIGQYNSSLDQRREAWVNSAQLPPGLKKDLKAGDHVKPSQTDPPSKPLAMLAQNEISMLEEHQQLLRDQALLGRSLNQNFTQRPDRGRPANRRGGRGQNFQQNSYQSRNYRGNRGRSQPRGGYRGGHRGRGNYNQPQPQPFSETQSHKKQE